MNNETNEQVIYNVLLMHLWYSYYSVENYLLDVNEYNYAYIKQQPIFKMLKDVMPEGEWYFGGDICHHTMSEKV